MSTSRETDIWKLRELGLGRGINATNPRMWQYKTSIGLREVSPDLSNVITTEGSRKREFFQEVIPTWAACQEEISSAMKEPEMSLKIGTHLAFSDDPNRIAVSQKIVNRTVAFSDAYANEPSTFSDSVFEMRLCRFIYRCLCPQSQQTAAQQISPIAALSDYIAILQQNRNTSYLQEITKACKEYITTTGITHYVSAIELGAMQYNEYSLSQYMEAIGAGMGSMGGPLSPAVISKPTTQAKWKLKLLNFKKAIGRMGNGQVPSEKEAVIGFTLQPIYKMVKQQHVRMALEKAVSYYIQANKTTDTFRCSMIASVSDDSKLVYWTVNQHNQVLGTELKEHASLFHILPAGSSRKPNEFLIRYDHKKKGYRTQHYYLKYKANLLGNTTAPLMLSSEIGDKFTVDGHTPLKPYLCASETNTLLDWTAGQDLYLKCSMNSMFKKNGYVSMRSRSIAPSTSPTQNHNSTAKKIYETIGVSSFQKESSTLFRLVHEDKPMIEEVDGRFFCTQSFPSASLTTSELTEMQKLKTKTGVLKKSMTLDPMESVQRRSSILSKTNRGQNDQRLRDPEHQKKRVRFALHTEREQLKEETEKRDRVVLNSLPKGDNCKKASFISQEIEKTEHKMKCEQLNGISYDMFSDNKEPTTGQLTGMQISNICISAQ